MHFDGYLEFPFCAGNKLSPRQRCASSTIQRRGVYLAASTRRSTMRSGTRAQAPGWLLVAITCTNAGDFEPADERSGALPTLLEHMVQLGARFVAWLPRGTEPRLRH